MLDTDGRIPLGPVIPSPSGLLSVTSSHLWVSTDGLHWQSRLPPDRGGIGHPDARRWRILAVDDTPDVPLALGRCHALDERDLGALETPEPAGLDWELILGIPVSSGGITIFPVTHRVTDPGLLLGREPTYRSEWPQEVEPGRYEVLQGTPRGSLAGGDPVVIEETPSGLRVSAEDGTLIGVIEGVDLDFIRAWGTRHGIEREQVGVVAGTSIVPVDLPGMPYPDLAAVQAPVVLDAPDGFRALATDRNGRLRAWRSSDGRTWEPATASDRSISELRTEPGYGHPTRVRDMGWPESSATSDGVTWETGHGLQFGTGEILTTPGPMTTNGRHCPFRSTGASGLT